MKISIIGPGIMPIPPPGWGAVECLIWDYAIELRARGYDVQIVNTSNRSEIIEQVNNFCPDFVHLQYDDFADVLQNITCNFKAATSHYGYIEQYEKHLDYFHHILRKFISGNFFIFCLSEQIKETYLKLGVHPDRLVVTPNGARTDLFHFHSIPQNSDKSIYLAKIDFRKRQYIYQGIKNLYFAGNCADSRFDITNESYLGEWNKEYLYNNLSHYANLVLLSDGEADPLVTKEALICGLGLVISEYAAANIDKSLPFIDIVPTHKLNDINYIQDIIDLNRQKSISNRESIRSYALNNHSWTVRVDNYIKIIDNIIKYGSSQP